ncbi:L,D-transpeptidase [Conexibacter woesei]|uniref:L,D-transpeptidase n=1 Tax=Conexibacter woesei TaxID=191495 RepID=UPI0004138161|nr:L,D-transpeptidase [Conexibacter woesei]
MTRALATVAALAAAGAIAGCGSASAPRHDGAAAAGGLPAPEPGGLRVGAPRALAHEAGATTWASVRTAAAARAGPGRMAARVGVLRPRTPEGTTNLVPVLARRRSGDALWVRVALPALPNGRTGWVPRAALGAYGTSDLRLVVDRRALTATLLRDRRVVFRAPVGIGTRSAPTPAGRFLVRNVLRRYRSAFYGPIAFGTSARSATLTDWPGGGYIGIHGTNEPGLIPGRVSHGCIRLRNHDLAALAHLLRAGTPVTIV